MKKFLSVLLCMAMLAASCCITSFASGESLDAAVITAPYQAGLLEYLGVMTNSQNTDWSKSVTRGDFAKYVYNISKLYSGSVNAYYTDVPAGSELEEAVSYLVSAGVLSVSDTRLFRPDDAVLFTEACKMLVNIAGYDSYAKATGGYPTGYTLVANKLDITDGVADTRELTRYDAAIMLYNTLHAGMFDVKYISNDGFVYNGSETETVLERFFGIYTVEGVVTMKNRVDLLKDGYSDIGVMCVDGVVYNDLIADKELLGYMVSAYVKDNEAGKDSVVYADISEENNVLEIDAGELESVSSKEIRYYDENGKLKTAKLSNAAFVKNGAVLGYDIPGEAMIDKGRLVLISNDGSSSYNTVIVTEYEILIMGHLDATNKRIYDKYDTSGYYDFNEEKLEEVKIFMNGKRANFMHIQDNDVLSVVRSKDGKFISAIISTDVVKGKIESVSYEEDTYITIDGKDYILDNALAGRISNDSAMIGDTVEMVLDATGQVAHIRAASNENYRVGYVHKYGVFGSSFTKTVALGIFGTDGENREYNIAQKVTINENRGNFDGDDVIDALADVTSPGNIKPQVIRYKLNGDGEIVGIITADYSSNMSQSGYLSKTLDEGNYTYRSNLVNMTTAINDKTVILQIPYDSLIREGNYEHYFKTIDKTFLRSSMNYTFEAYKTNEDTPYTDVLLCKKDRPYKDDTSDSVGIVRKITRAQNGYGVDVYAMEMFVDGIGVKNITNDVCVWKDADDNDISPMSVKEGDFVRFNTDGQGSVGYVKCLFSPSQNSSREALDGMVGNYDARLRLTFHYVADKFEGSEMDNGGIVSLVSMSDEFGGDVTWRLQYSRLNKAIIYDSTKREGSRVYIGNVDNIISYNGTGGADASVFITHATIGSIKNVYIIN